MCYVSQESRQGAFSPAPSPQGILPSPISHLSELSGQMSSAPASTLTRPAWSPFAVQCHGDLGGCISSGTGAFPKSSLCSKPSLRCVPWGPCTQWVLMGAGKASVFDSEAPDCGILASLFGPHWPLENEVAPQSTREPVLAPSPRD